MTIPGNTLHYYWPIPWWGPIQSHIYGAISTDKISSFKSDNFDKDIKNLKLKAYKAVKNNFRPNNIQVNDNVLLLKKQSKNKSIHAGTTQPHTRW